MSDYESWSAEQWRDECERMRAIVQSLEAAEKAGTPREALIVLADESGVGALYRKHHEPT
jgi:hypothetical protein